MRDRQNGTTTRPMVFFLTLSSDHITGATGISPTVTVSKNAGAFASPVGTVSQIGNGWYALAGDVTDRNTLGDFAIHATGSGCDPSDTLYTVVAYDPFSVTNLGLTNLDAAMTSRSTLAYTDVVPVRSQAGVTAPILSDCLQGGWSSAFAAESYNGTTTLVISLPAGGTAKSFTVTTATAGSTVPLARS